MVQISLSTSTDFAGGLNALVEALGNALTIRFDLDEPAPEGGLKVFVDSNVEQIVNRLDLPGFAFNQITENINPALIGTSFDNSGFFLTIDEGATFGSFTIDVFDNPEPDTFLPETFDGLVEAVFELKTQDQVESEDLGDVGILGDYTIDPNAASSTVLFADEESQLTEIPEPPTPEPPPTDLPLVSLHTGPDFLVEADGTVSAHVFNVTGGTIPEGGLVVSVSASGLGEFDLEAIAVGDGGEIVAVREDGFDIRLTDFTVLIDLPIAEDGEAEGLETASFTLEAGEGYQVNSDFSSGEFSITDTGEEVPFNTSEPNDTFSLARETGLSADNSQISLSGTIDFDIGNRYLNEDGSYTYVDNIEDVDFYKFELKAGDVIAVDANNGPRGVLDIVQNIFDAEGNILAYDQQDPGPDDFFAVGENSYQEFKALNDGTYYLGISAYANGLSNRQVTEPEAAGLAYNPLVPGSGTGYSFDAFGYLNIGEYDLTITLNPETRVNPPGLNRSNNTPPDTLDLAQPGEPTVSLGFFGVTFAPLSDEIISQGLVENLPEASFLAFTLQTEGEIPEEGIVVTINSNIYLRDYINDADLSGPPFSPGSQIIGAVTDETGLETGFQVRIFEPNTFFGFNAKTPYLDGPLEPETDGPEEATFFLEGGEGYGVAPDANQFTTTFYDSLEQVPAPSVIPEVSFSISNSELIESEGTVVSLNFSLSEPPPEEGIVVYVTSENQGILPQFQVLNLSTSGGIFPIPDGQFTGFYFKITQQEASITLPVFADPFAEGLQSYSFTLQETPFYTINPDAGKIDFTIADTPDSVLEVSLRTESEVLVESENTVSILTFNLTAQPPSEGITVTVDAPNLGEFDVEAIAVAGGEITEVTDSGFSLKITDATATVELPVAEDGEAEGLETATFSLVESTNSTINPDTNEVTFSLYDNPKQVPVTEEFKKNNTIPEAIDLNLNPENLNATISGRIYQFDVEDFASLPLRLIESTDLTEDVDFYSFELQAGDTVKIDLDSIPFELVDGPNGPLYEIDKQQLDSELRLFDAEGNELASVNNAAAPDEEFSRDPYLEFTASEAGSYYVGVSQLGNRNYDPFVEESGSGWSFPEIGVFFGDYELNAELTSEGDTEEPVVSFTATPELISEADGSVLTLTFETTGTLPTEGIDVRLQGDVANILTQFTAAQTRFDENLEPFNRFDRSLVENGVTGGVLDLFALEDDLSSFTFTITDPTATIEIPVLNDLLEEADQTFTYTLESGDGYQVSPEANSATFTVTDGVPGGVGPTISIAAEPTTLIESEQTALTVTFTTNDPLPEGGIVVSLDSGVPLAVTEFDFTVDNPRNPEDELNPVGIITEGGTIVGSNETASSVLFRITEQTASLTVPVLDDGVAEGSESFTYTLLNGEEYEVDPDASSISFAIEDDADTATLPVFGTPEADIFDVGVTPGFDGSGDIAFAGAGDDLLDTSAGSGGNRLYGQSGDDTLFLGSNDRAFGGAGDDRFFLLGGDNIVTGGADADQFWIANGEIPEATNIITDFTLDGDVLGVGGLGIGFEDLTLTQDGGNTLIAFGDDELAKLLGVNSSSLSASNFAFA